MTHKSVQDLIREAQQEVEAMSCAEYAAIIKADKPHVLLDVREPAEFEAGHFKQAINIPRGVIEFNIAEQIPDKDMLVVICCASGVRAALAGETLEEMGYSNVEYLDGGYEQCKKEIE